MGILTLFLITFFFMGVIIILMAVNPFIRKKGHHAKREQSYSTLWRKPKHF